MTAPFTTISRELTLEAALRRNVNLFNELDDVYLAARASDLLEVRIEELAFRNATGNHDLLELHDPYFALAGAVSQPVSILVIMTGWLELARYDCPDEFTSDIVPFRERLMSAIHDAKEWIIAADSFLRRAGFMTEKLDAIFAPVSATAINAALERLASA